MGIERIIIETDSVAHYYAALRYLQSLYPNCASAIAENVCEGADRIETIILSEYPDRAWGYALLAKVNDLCDAYDKLMDDVSKKLTQEEQQAA